MLSEKDVESVVKHEVGHYILNRYNDIVPTAIHFKYNSYDSLNGECEIQYNICLDIFSEVSKLSYQRAMVLFAGAAAEFLNFESKKIDQRKAKLDFEARYWYLSLTRFSSSIASVANTTLVTFSS